MKKYILVLFAFAFSFGLLFYFNINVVSAADSGCTGAGPYSTTTGQLCNTAGVVTCQTGDLFNALTGQKCTSWQQPPTRCTIINPVFNIGARGGAIGDLQRSLIQAGENPGPIDGNYGPKTEAAVARYRMKCYPTPPPQNPNFPVISGVSGPQTLNVDQQGTWKVTANDRNDGYLSYSVNWGDTNYAVPSFSTAAILTQQAVTFTHSYSQAGTYTATFTVTSENTIRCITTPCSSNGGSAQTSLTVNVGNGTTPSDTYTYKNHGFTIELPKGYIPQEEQSEGGPSISITLPSYNHLNYWTDASWWVKYNLSQYSFKDEEMIGTTTFKVYYTGSNQLIYWFQKGNVGYEFSGEPQRGDPTDLLKTFHYIGWPQTTLTQAQAQTLVLQTWGGCTPDTCGSVSVTVQNNNGQYTVTAIYEGLRDDSASAQKKVAPAYYNNGVWTLGNATITQRCQPGRGHQDFSSVLCI